MCSKSLPSEWSYMFDASSLPETGAALVIAPNADERGALVHRLDLVDIQSLSAQIAVMPDKGGVIHVQGIITARITQKCVTTLAPVITDIKDDFDAWFADVDAVVSFAKAKQSRSKNEERPILLEQEDPEPMIDGQIDLGELVTQFLSLSIPDFPHDDGVMPVGDDPAHSERASDDTQTNPFAALKDWKDRQR